MKKIQKRKSKVILRRLFLVVIGLILGVHVYLANARNIVGNQMPMPFGIGSAVVLSGSMEPVLSRGDLIFVQETEEVNTGDIVVYQLENSLIVHRVITVSQETVVTKGDANNTADEPIKREQIKGVVRLHIPYIGIVLNVMKTPAGIIVTLILAFVLTERSFSKEKEDDEKNREAVKEEIRRLKKELEK